MNILETIKTKWDELPFPRKIMIGWAAAMFTLAGGLLLYSIIEQLVNR